MSSKKNPSLFLLNHCCHRRSSCRPLEVPGPHVGNHTNTRTHTLLTLLHSFLVSSDWEADAAQRPNSANLHPPSWEEHRGQSPLRLHFYLFTPFFLYILLFSPSLPCVRVCARARGVCARVAAVSMQGNERHRKKEPRRPWTNGQLLFYKCTLYLFVVCSLELKSSVSGEDKTTNKQTNKQTITKTPNFHLFSFFFLNPCSLKGGIESRHLAWAVQALV